MRTAVLVAVAVASLARVAHADDKSPSSPAAGDDSGDRQDKGAFGAGIVLGEPTGICAKLYIADDRAIAAAVGSAFIGGGFQATADYLFHPYILQKRDAYVVPFYVGPGVRIIDYRKDGTNASYGALGLRGVAGILFDFKNGVPIDAYMEAAIVFEHGLSSGHGFEPAINAGAGVRYYF
jgi:hypothetical protein